MKTPPTAQPSRRQALAALLGAGWLTACGGSDDPPAGAPGQPRIIRFGASPTATTVGESVDLVAEFSHGQGRIEPDVGPVTSGVAVRVGPLDRDRLFRLVVSNGRDPDVSRELRVSVGFQDRWSTLAATWTSAQHATAVVPDGRVLLIGGSRGESVLSHRVDRFDPRTGTVESIGQLDVGRSEATATVLPDGQVLVVGGSVSQDDPRRVERIDPLSGAVTAAGRLSVSRVGHAAAPLSGGRVLVCGGVTIGEGATLGVSRSAEIWEPATGTFRRLASEMVAPRLSHTLTPLPDGRVLVVGGYSWVTDPGLAEIFDPTTETFSPLSAPFPNRASHLTLVQPDGPLLVLGGDVPQPGSEDPLPIASVLRYTPEWGGPGRFEAVAPLREPRTMAAGVMLPSGQVLLAGGQGAALQALATAERYDPALGGVAAAALDGPRMQHSLVRTASGTVVALGGTPGGLGYSRSVQVYR